MYIARTDAFLDVSKIIYDYILLAIPLGHFHPDVKDCDELTIPNDYNTPEKASGKEENFTRSQMGSFAKLILW